jgi:uncharacterized oligopeptide transporter (OPT) family protein
MKTSHIMLGAAGLLAATPAVFAEAAIANDTLEGMPQVGSDIGDFLKNLAPGLGAFVLILGVFIGIVGIIAGVAMLISHLAKKGFGK